MPDEKQPSRKKRDFTTAPTAVLNDTRLTSLDIRCLMVIALHDGMSAKRGSGAGCYARYSTLANLVGTDVTNFSKSVSRLLKFGYVSREQQQSDRRRYTLRVLYDHDEKLGEQTNKSDQIVGEAANKVVGDGERETRGNPPKTDPHYISLSEEIDFDESKEINSSEEARLAFRETRCGPFSGSIGEVLNGTIVEKKDSAEARLGMGELASITALLPKTWFELAPEAQLNHFERAFAKLNRNSGAIVESERKEYGDWLECMAEAFEDEPAGFQANRLAEEFYQEMAA